jgi:1,4-dihydroxy-2-naphthoyl-CoA hydrolase
MPYEHTWKIRFDDVDRAGILFYPELFRASHRAVEDYMEYLGYQLGEIVEDGWGMPVVHAEADYHIPLIYGDSVRLEVTANLGDTSIQFDITGYTEDDETAFKVGETHVTVKMETFETIEIPSNLRAAITE